MENYFRDALHNFIFEEAGGGAIRHLANRGYTAKQIADSLSFPVPYEKVREALTKHFLESGILLRHKPGTGIIQEKTEFVREYDKYGKPSFRKVAVLQKTEQRAADGETAGGGRWKEMDFPAFLQLYQNGAGEIKLPEHTACQEAEKNMYISCGFGSDKAGRIFQALDGAEAEYIRGICWMKGTMYHLLDRRMFGIALKLWKAECCRREAVKEEERQPDGRNDRAKGPDSCALRDMPVEKVYILH